MKIRFKKKRLYLNLILGILWVGLGIFNLIEDDDLHWLDYGNLVFGSIYIGHYLFDIMNQYLTIENGTIRKNRLYGNGRKIYLSEINFIQKFAGDYTLKTDNQKLIISTELIEKNSLDKLNEILQKLDIPSDKTPFVNIK